MIFQVKSCSEKFRKIRWKKLVSEPFYKAEGYRPATFLKKESDTVIFHGIFLNF